MAFDMTEILNGGLSLVFVLVSVAVGINIISRYFRLKNSTYLYMGLSWIGITSPWWGSTISFFTYIIMGKGIDLWFYLVMTLTFVPVFFMFYAKAITDLLWKDYQTLIMAIFFIIGIIFEGFYLYCSFTAPETIGSLEQETDIRYFNFVTFYLIFTIFTLMIFGILFGKVSLKSENPTVQAQGKFLIMAFVSFAIGAVFDSIIPLNPITLPITRGVLISSSLSFYCGFILPNWLKKKL